MENIRTIVCKNFNRLVGLSGMTKREIAQQMNISEATLQRWKSGVSFPELPNIEKLAKILKVDEVEFYSSVDPVTKNEPVSNVLKRMMCIPDEVYDKAVKVGVNHNVWETVIDALDVAIELQEEASKNA